jgi:hypothetical protein
MSKSMDEYYKPLLAGMAGIAGGKIGSAVSGKSAGAGGLIAAGAGSAAARKILQKKAKGGVVRKMKKGGRVK